MDSTAEDPEGLTLIDWTGAIAIRQGDFRGVDDFETRDCDRDAVEQRLLKRQVDKDQNSGHGIDDRFTTPQKVG